MSESIYSGTITARNGSQVPTFTNGRTFFSSYNPDRDADNFITAHKEAFDNAGCILVGGIGNGIHLSKLAGQYAGVRIIAFESDSASLSFAKTLLPADFDSEIILTTADELQAVLLTNYIPALHGNFAFAAVRSWSDFLSDKASIFVALVNETISAISADYSVQAQFGKLWHRNILLNISLYDSIPSSLRFNAGTFISKADKAAIIGAGPSLDVSLKKLAADRSSYCIFATDTTLSTITSAGITPDFVVTVDSQPVSEKHFVGQSLKGTVLAADLTGNCSIIKNAVEQNTQILLFHNNHPLSALFDMWLTDVKRLSGSVFPVIDSGAGTVLHAATDLARKLGFTELEFFGADFSYSEGKPYTKGTYLEKQFYAQDERTGNAETAYSQLMYRTPLIAISDTSFTTEVLTRYKNSLQKYLENQSTSQIKNTDFDVHSIKTGDFIPWYHEKLQKKDEKVLFSILPLAAWYKKIFSNADTECVYAFAEEQTANVGRIQCHLQRK